LTSPDDTSESYQSTYPFNFSDLLKSQDIESVFQEHSPLRVGSVMDRAQEDGWLLNRVARLHRIEKCPEVPRTLCHGDWLLREVNLMATDYHQERVWKLCVAKLLAKVICWCHRKLNGFRKR
jgi:hypothetical protein